MVSFHVLIATIGRPSLQRLLDSLLPQLTVDDHVTIVFDGVVPTSLSLVGKANIHIHREHVRLGSWGHGIRNKYAPLLEKTDFVMHADDDDTYTNTFDILRKRCVDTQTLYVTRMLINPHRLIPDDPVIRKENIGTPNGVIPYEKNKQSQWALRLGGDGAFYEGLSTNTPVVFLNVVTYMVRSVQRLAFLPGFYINLDSRPDRRREFEVESYTLGFQVERFPAIHAPYTPPAIGCSKSHLECLKLAKLRKYPYVFIFEDDFECLVTKQEFHEVLGFIPYEFDVVMLSYYLCRSEPYDATFGKVLECQTTSGYVVHARFYETLIACFEEGITRMEHDPSRNNIRAWTLDQYWKRLQPKSKWLYSLKRLGRQRASYSDIERKHMDYGV
jgi:glycosyl transferase, family 25